MSTAATVATPAAKIGTKPLLVRRAAVLGAGTMGSRIAAHLANAGIPVLLLDLPSKPGTSDRPLAHAAINALFKSKPAAFFDPSAAALITPGTFDDDLPKIADCDWVIEAVAENLEIKTALLTRVLPHLGPHALLTTNTSGLPIAQIAAAIASPSPEKILRHAFFQSSALHASPRSHPHRRFGSRPRRRILRLRRSAASASRSSSRTTRPTSLPIASASRSCSTPPI